MKKKLLTIAVTAAMVLSLVACGSNGGNNETKAVETSGSETAAESAVSESNGENTESRCNNRIFRRRESGSCKQLGWMDYVHLWY